MVQHQNIPPELKVRPQWVCWVFEVRDGKLTKIPINPQTGLRASTAAPDSWSTFEVALAAFQNVKGFAGIGYVFSPEDPYVGIDVDNCLASNGCLTEEGQEALARFGSSYFEISPSGTGLKIWIIGHLPTEKTGRKNPARGIEAYQFGRFFTVTGQALHHPANRITDCNEALQIWLRTRFSSPTVPFEYKVDTVRCERSADDIIHETILCSPRLAKLFNGEFECDYASQSEADLALCMRLAGLIGPDPHTIDEVFRASGLYRDKWDRDDYRLQTITKAIQLALGNQATGKHDFEQVISNSQTQSGVNQMSMSNSVNFGIMSAWSAPKPLISTCPAMTVADFPPSISQMIQAVSEHTETPVELPGLLALGVLATACQRRFHVECQPGYSEPLCLWVCPSLEPGNRKSAVMSHMSEPILSWQLQRADELAPEIRQRREARTSLEKRVDHLRNKAAREEDAAVRASIEREIWQELAKAPTELVKPVLFTQDCTPEQVARLLSLHGERLAVISDEAGIFGMMAGRYSKGVPNLDVYLQGHAGAPVMVDRKGSEAIQLTSPCLTIAISPQPSVLRQAASIPDFNGRGLLDRFLLSIPESNLGYRQLSSHPIPDTTVSSWRRLIHSILAYEAFGPVSQPLYLSAEAFNVWKSEQIANEAEMRPNGVWSSRRGWASKYPGAVLRIAGLLHIAEAVSQGYQPTMTQIPQGTMQWAVHIGRKVKVQSAHAFAYMLADPRNRLMEKLAAWILREQPTQFTTRDAQRAVNGGRRSDGLEEALDFLAERNWIFRTPRAQNLVGRPTICYLVNPEVHSIRKP